MPEQGPLSGRRIVLTRPAQQNAALAARIRALGGEPILCPVLAIGEIADQDALADAVARLADGDLAIFVSPNAVARVMPHVQARGGWPAGLKAATVGPATAAALREHGLSRVIVPQDRFDSEHLLALLPDDMSGRRVFIFRGQDGRPLLGDALCRRGARVEYVACYTRTRPPGQMPDALSRPVDAIVVTSSEGLRNLVDMLGEAARPLLDGCTLFVPHARIGEAARALGWRHIVETGPGDAGVLSALERFWAKVQGT